MSMADRSDFSLTESVPALAAGTWAEGVHGPSVTTPFGFNFLSLNSRVWIQGSGIPVMLIESLGIA